MQGNAKELYLLTDSDFKKLGSLAKANPKHKDWVAMRLYLESQARTRRGAVLLPGAARVSAAASPPRAQVRGAAHTKYGGEQGIKDRRAKQLATQAERRTKKRTQELDKARCRPRDTLPHRLAALEPAAAAERPGGAQAAAHQGQD